jgi:hypothetical protein
MKASPLRSFLPLFLSVLLLAPLSAPAPPPTGATLTYRRVFKSSSPEFIEVKVREESDAATYEIRQLADEPGAVPFEVGAVLRAKLFALTAQVKNFDGIDLDIHRKIAYLGEKTFRWERGKEAHEATFNYTLDATASQLMQIFEGLARQQENLEVIMRRMKYDRLGVNDALLEFEADLNRNLMPEPQRALPALDQIAADSHIVGIARQRARSLAERIRRLS